MTTAGTVIKATTRASKRRNVAEPNHRSTNNVHKIMGNRLRDIRLERDISQQSLAQALGLSFQQIQKYEKGVNRIDAARLLDIAVALGCDIDDFYGDLTERKIAIGVTDRARYLATPEAHRLIRAMLAIEQPQVRRKLISLAETLGGLMEDADVD